MIDDFLRGALKWRDEFVRLRAIILEYELSEDMKWGWPCYALQGRNIVLIHGFKEYCALLFFKGAMLADPEGHLIQQTANVQAARQMRFTGVQAIVDMEAAIRSTVLAAIEAERDGLTVPLKTTGEFSRPDELQSALKERPELKAAFEALTPGRQRAYLLHFSSPKQSKTRQDRVDKAIVRILAGKGLND